MRRRIHPELAAGLQRQHVAGLKIGGNVGIALFDQIGAGRRFRNGLFDDALEERQLSVATALPVIVPPQHHLLARLEDLDRVGAAAGRIGLQPFLRPRIFWRRVLLGQFAIEDRRQRRGKIG